MTTGSSTKAEVVLHIGTMKSGTSYIQAVLRRNKRLLSRDGVLVPRTLARFIAVKGSVALDGISLTVNAVEGDTFSVLVIPHTLQVTTFGALRMDDDVNLEVDTMARYAARLAQMK